MHTNARTLSKCPIKDWSTQPLMKRSVIKDWSPQPLMKNPVIKDWSTQPLTKQCIALGEHELDWAQDSVNYNIHDLLSRAVTQEKNR